LPRPGRAADRDHEIRGRDVGARQIEKIMKFNPGQYIREIRREVSKVTWPSRKETTVSTGMVFLMVFVAAVFFFLVDQVLSNVVKLILSF
jgi:preprotein translocase subunit SecE